MIKFDDQYIKKFIKSGVYEEVLQQSKLAVDKIYKGTGQGNEYLGWVNLPEDYDKTEFDKIKQTAKKICHENDVLVVIGVGGSYLGARAVIDLLGAGGIEIIFAGKDLSSIEVSKTLKRLDGKDWSINVISKSGTTLEPGLAFRIFRDELRKKYGDLSNQRIYATTDVEKGTLHDLAVKNNWERFVVPNNIGGRFSVLTAVGLLPIACAGIDIDKLMFGAKNATSNIDSATKYAVNRNLLYQKGYFIEVLSCFEPSFASFNEWWKQLFGESEGKNRKGIFPASMIFTTDLHSLGQYVQDGKRQLIETFIHFEKSPVEIKIPDGKDDGLEYLNGKNLSFVNQIAYEATVKAHHDGGVPIMTLTLPEISPESVGELIYFMEMSCALSAYILGVNPFNQPGVEEYKKNMLRGLNKSQNV